MIKKEDGDLRHGSTYLFEVGIPNTIRDFKLERGKHGLLTKGHQSLAALRRQRSPDEIHLTFIV